MTSSAHNKHSYCHPLKYYSTLSPVLGVTT